MDSVFEIVITIVAGTFVGTVAGLLGVGGSFLLVPILSELTSFPIQVIVGSCACQILGPSTTAMISQRFKLEDIQIPMILLGGFFIGTLVGAKTLYEISAIDQTGSESSSELSASTIIRLSYLGLLWILGIFSYWEARRDKQGKHVPIGWLRLPFIKPGVFVFGRNELMKVSVLSLSWFGLGVGFLSGFMGLSGGVVLLPALHFAYGIPTKRAAMMCLVSVWMIAAQSTIIHACYQNIDLRLVVLLLLGGTIGAKVGVQFSQRLTGGRMRRRFALLVLSTALLLTVFMLVRGG